MDIIILKNFHNMYFLFHIHHYNQNLPFQLNIKQEKTIIKNIFHFFIYPNSFLNTF